MGAKTSTQEQQQVQPSSPYEQKYYHANTQTYSTLDHQKDLVSNDVTRLANQEIQNLQKYKQLTYSSFPQTSTQKENVITSSSKKYSGKKDHHLNRIMPKTQLALRKSQSTDNLSDSTTVITAQQLLYDQAK